MAKKVEREHRRQAEARHVECQCAECRHERAKRLRQFVDNYGGSRGMKEALGKIGVTKEDVERVAAEFEKMFPEALRAASDRDPENCGQTWPEGSTLVDPRVHASVEDAMDSDVMDSMTRRSLASQRYVALHGADVYTADGRCMVASCDGGHLDEVRAAQMAERIARLLTADSFEQANVRHARRTGMTLTKITGCGELTPDALLPSEDYVFAVEELKRQVSRVEKILRSASSTKTVDELWRCAERLKSAMAAFAAVDPNAARQAAEPKKRKKS